MSAISWGGRIYGASDLFTAAREARANRWLTDPARKFLYHVGICLATDRPVSERQMVFLGRVLRRLTRLGSKALAVAPAPRAEREALRAATCAPLGFAQAPAWTSDDVDLEALERDIAAMRLFLASATERVEGYWERLQRLKQARRPEDPGGCSRTHT